MKKLTVRQARFVECYDGNGAEAARQAGYSERWAASNLDKLLKNTAIRAAIREREKERTSSLIATREQRQRFWTSVMNDEDIDLRDRLRASELLGKSEGDFLERVKDESGPGTPNISVNFVSKELEGVLSDPESRKMLAELYAKSTAV